MRSRWHRTIMAAGALLVVLLAAAHADEAFEQSKKTYEEAVAKLASDAAAGEEKLLAAYEQSLDKILAGFQAQGNLDQLLLAQREKARFEQDRSVPPAPDAAMPPSVIDLQARFNAAVKKSARDGLRRRATLTKQYAEHLRKIIKRLVVDGQIDDAKAVDTELKSVEAGLAVMSADLVDKKSTAAYVPKKPAGAPTAVPPPAETPLKSLVRRYRDTAFELDFSRGARSVTRDPRTGGYFFDGEKSCVPWDNDIPRKIGAKDFTLVFDFQPARQKTDTAYLVEHHRGFPWTGLFVAIENNRSLRFRVKDLPHNDISCDIAEMVGSDRFHSVALSRRGRDLEIAIDGQRVAREEQPEIADLDIDYGGNRLMVGTHCEEGPNYYAGALRNVAIFTGEALSPQDIERLAR